MSYIIPAEFAQKVVDSGYAKLHMSRRDVLIRSCMAGAILALSAAFAITVALQTGSHFSVMDYLLWNEISTVLGNLAGGLLFTGLALYTTHVRTAPQRVL